jgi:diadenosine tetraphosphate (Ap4A) HIT family hydrolase
MAMDTFHLNPRLEADTTFVADWGFSRLLLMNDARFPWIILVPRRADLSEIHDLKHAERMVLIEEINRASEGLKKMTGAKKINTAAFGNVVPQLHVHVIARFENDVAWDSPVWGSGPAVAYEQGVKTALIEKLRAAL